MKTLSLIPLLWFLNAQPLLREPFDIQDLTQTNQVNLSAEVSSLLVTNYHIVFDYTNETASTRSDFWSASEPPADLGDIKDSKAFVEGLRKQRIREIKEIPTLRFSWMGKTREITETNVLMLETNHETLRWLEAEKHWKWIPDRHDNDRFPPR